MKPQSIPFAQRLRKASPAILPLLALLIAGGALHYRSHPAVSAQPDPDVSQPPMPEALHDLVGAAPLPIGALREAAPDPLDAERMARVEAAVAAFTKGRKEGTLVPTVRREPIPSSDSRPPWVSPESLLSERQQRALNDLRWRAEKNVSVRVTPEDRSIRMLAGRRLEEPATTAAPGLTLAATTARQFLRRNADLFALTDPDSELRIVHEGTDDLGITHVRMRQQWQGVEVWPADVSVQMDKHGAVTLFMGTYRPSLEGADTTPAVTAEDGRAIAQRAVREASGAPVPGAVQEESLVFYAPDRKTTPRLAWQHVIHGGLLTDWHTFVDATSGEVIVTDKTACAAATTGSGTDLFGQTKTINLWQDGSTYWMVDTTKQMFVPAESTPPAATRVKGGITLHDANGISDQEYNQIRQPNTAIAQIASTSRTAGFNADAVSASVDVGKVYDWLLSRHGRNSYDGNGGTVTVVVNVDFANATFNWGTGTMTFGLKKLSGQAGREYYARAFDVTAHEMAHGVTGTTAGLVYEFQSGAMNEAFSDILGETAEAMVYRSGQPDWLLGTNMTEQIRDMRNPGAFQQPAKMREYQNLDRSQDNGGVHVNSGIINHAFYQLAEGLSPGVGLDKAESIFYRALTGGKLQRNSQFVDCRLACLAAATELYGAGSTEAQKVAAAFDVVEIFDQQAPPPPPSLPQTSGADSTLFTFYWTDGYLYLGRREAAAGDGASGTFLNFFATLMPFTRPAVKGDGTEAFVVLSNNDAAFVDTVTGGLFQVGLPGQIASVGRSADGRFYGFVFINPFSGQRDNRISVYDSSNGQSRSYELLSPAMDGNAANTVLYADALDFSSDGSLLVYDALNRVKDQFGYFRDTYSIYFLERTSGQVFALAAPDPDYNVGNPAIGQRHNNFVTFEAEDQQARVSYVVAKDLASPAIAQIAAVSSVNGVAFPGYTGGDDAIVFSDPGFGVIASRSVGQDGVTPTANAVQWIGGHVGVIYRRGTYVQMPTLSVGVADASAAEGGSDTASMLVSRTGGDGTAVPFSVVITGTAGNGSDFNRLPLNFTLPAGVTSATISFVPVDDNLVEGTESMTLTLQDGINYRAGSTVSGTMTIADNDADAYDAWLRSQFGDAVVNNPALKASQWGPDADPDGDKLSNLMEAYFGTNPKAPSRVDMSAARAANGDLLLRWTEADDTRGLVATPEWSGNLGTWLKTGQSGPGIGARTITVTNLGGSPGKRKEAKLSSSGFSRAAMRLRISRQ